MKDEWFLQGQNSGQTNRNHVRLHTRLTPKERIMDITLTDEPIRGKELSALLNVFGFSPKLETGTEQTNTAHIIFRQRILLLDMTRDSVIRYAENMTGEDQYLSASQMIKQITYATVGR